MNKFEDLRPYQLEAIDFIRKKKKVGLWLDMGLGKTTIAATALMNSDRVLVIAPKNTAINTWPDEFKQWEHLKDLSVALCIGSAEQRTDAINKNARFTIINRENVPWLVDKLLNVWPFDSLIIDESTSFKNGRSKRFLSIKKVLKYITNTVLLTGTPAPNGLIDLWAQTYLLDNGERLCKYVTTFKSRYFDKNFNGFSYTPKQNSRKIIMDLISDLYMTVHESHAPQLPDRRFDVVRVQFDYELKDKYKELLKHSISEFDGVDIVGVNAAALYNKLLQFSNGRIYDQDKNSIRVHELKLDALADILKNSKSNVLLAYQFISDYEAIRDRFDFAVNIKDQGAIKRWNNGGIKLLCAHPASAAHGLNLQRGGSVCVWYGLSWDLELYQQFNKRLHRSGQKDDVQIITIVAAGCIDDVLISNRLTDKAKLQDQLVRHIYEN